MNSIDAFFLNIVLIGTALFVVPVIIAFICMFIADKFRGSVSGSGLSSVKNKGKSSSYTRADKWGCYIGTSYVNGSDADHYSINGYQGSSYRSGNDIIHYDTGGYQGRSYVDGDTINHYSKDSCYSGYSKMNSSGGFDNYDKWGLYVGSTREE